MNRPTNQNMLIALVNRPHFEPIEETAFSIDHIMPRPEGRKKTIVYDDDIF